MGKFHFDLMEKCLSAYSDAHILRYFDEVRKNGLTEHGFPRLTSNIGILIANGRRRDLTDLFMEMMEFCCKSIPSVKAANDFSVREIICCIAELEKNQAAAPEHIRRWKQYLSTIEPETCYSVFAKAPTDPVRNWALFTAVSEFFRLRAGICEKTNSVDPMEFIEIQIASQLQWLDENGMYMDNEVSDIHQPMVYDLVPRLLFSMLLFAGYRGRYYEKIDACLKHTGLLTLRMQSVTGELAFGGRSNQFIHNEAWLSAIFEYEAARYQKEGDAVTAQTYKAAAARALESVSYWLEKQPISHVKNRFPIDSCYGCEQYAYFDKYMITAASFFYVAHLFCDETVLTASFDDSPMIWQSSAHFHKVFMRAGGYALEFDTNADRHYDASGLGRIHKYGAPSAICLSVPCPSEARYTVDLEHCISASICPGILEDGAWKFASNGDWIYELTDKKCSDRAASVDFACSYQDIVCVHTKYTADESGVLIEMRGNGDVALMLPAFVFDGENNSDLSCDETCLTVSYEDWICRYTVNGAIFDTEKYAVNRNGHYRIFYASAKDTLTVKVEIVRDTSA